MGVSPAVGSDDSEPSCGSAGGSMCLKTHTKFDDQEQSE